MTVPRAPLIAGLAAYGLVGLVAVAYLAGALYYLALKTVPTQLNWDTWWSAWQQFGPYPAHRGKLQFALGAALVGVFVVPPLVATQLLTPRPSLHGDARFARPHEVAAAGLFTSERGIIVGRDRGRYLIYGGQQFVLLAAPTRSGKGVGVVIPNLLNYPDSVVVLDIKQENFQITSGYRAAHGQAVYLFNPFAEDGATHRWNPLDGIDRDPTFRIGDILAIGQALYPHDASNRDAFWNDQGRNLFLGLTLYLLETPVLPCTFGELLRQASGKGRPLKEHLQQIMTERTNGQDALSGACLDALNRFVSTSDNTLSGILATFNAPLTIFANPIVDAATSASDFALTDVRRRPMSIYLGIQPNRLADAGLLINLFFSQLVNLNTRELPEHNPDLKCQCLLILDEFTSIGKIGILASAVAFIAGYNLRLLPIVQSIAQLQSVYGDRDTRTFVTNHAMQVVFAPREQRDADEYSQMLGYFTETARSQSVSRPLGFYHQNAGSHSENRSDQRRALMLPQELRELGPQRQIVFLQGAKPILCDKNRYFDDPLFQARLLPPVVIDPIDIDLHRARIEQRTRVLLDDEPILAERLAIGAIPDLDDPVNPSPESMSAFVTGFLDSLEWEIPDPPAPAAAAPKAASDVGDAQRIAQI